MRQLNAGRLTLVLCLLLVDVSSAQESAPVQNETRGAWRDLFNGENLDGWEANIHPESFSVSDGLLKAHGKNGMSHLFFVGETGKDVTFKNFELVAEAKSEPNSNSGIFFHTDRELRKGKYLNKGYEVQLNSSKREKQKTGSLYSVRPVDVSPVDETEWFELRILVYGKHIQVFVDGQQVVDYVEPASAKRPPARVKRLIDPNGGALAIQAHDPNSIFCFRRIRIRELNTKPDSEENAVKDKEVKEASDVTEGESGDTLDTVAVQKAGAEEMFRKRVTPFIKTYCLDCHQNKRPTEAGVNFSPALKAPGHAAFSQLWRKAAARVTAHDMPPEDLEQPSEKERQMFAEWLGQVKYLSPKDPGPFIIRRLTKAEFGNTLHDLFGVDRAVVDALPEEVSGEGYLNSISPLQMEQYLAIAQKVVHQCIAPEGEAPTTWQAEWIGEPVATASSQQAAKNLAVKLASKAYRRPASAAEIKVLLDVFELGQKNSLSYLDSVRLMVKAVLVSPQFLFITPVDNAVAEEAIVLLDDYQLASRLSYLLWATMPDAELIELADAGKLHETPILEEQITRLLASPRSRALFDGFGAQWLGVNDLPERNFDPELFPQMTQGLRMAMLDEVRLLFESIVQNNLSVDSFINCDFTFLNRSLAELYGMQDVVAGQEFQKVQLADRNRGGILSMPGILASTSFPNRTSAVNRGVWVLEQVLGDHVPSAPPDVPALESQDQHSAAELTLRERTEMHRKDPVCANCHKILDPIGFGLENFDAIGRWREVDDNGEAIDASGELPGGKRFETPSELKAIVAERIDDFARNIVEKLLAYALCRRLEGYDEIVVDEIMRDVARDEYRMQTIIRSVVTSYPFTYRRIQEERASK